MKVKTTSTCSTLPIVGLQLPKIRIPEVGDLPEAYFDAQKGRYLVSNGRKGWMPANEEAMRRRLRGLGLNAAKEGDDYLSQVDVALQEITDQRNFDYAGPLAGRACGLYDILGTRILVTEPPTLVAPAAGDWPLLRQFLFGLLDGDDIDQSQYFLGWLRIALECLYAGIFRPGQALVLAGPKRCGKSLLQNLITILLGNRAAKPYQFMTGATQFNSDLIGAEHLMIEDEADSYEIQKRRVFGGFIKQFTSAETHRCHPKGRQPLTLTPFWRVTISVNDEPENLLVMPPIDESLEDKFILLRAFSVEMPMPTVTIEERTAFWVAITRELPAFVHWLLNEWKLSDALTSPRYGVTHFHHPEILHAIHDLAPETRLLTLIDKVVFGKTAAPSEWEGSAADLQAELEADGQHGREVRDLLRFPSVTGKYLARLAHRFPQRFFDRTLHGGRVWKITAKPIPAK